MLETSLEGFSRCWRLLGFSRFLRLLRGDFHGAGDFWRFSQGWKLLWRDFHGAGDDFWDFHSAGDFFGWIFTVLETSSGDFQGAGDFFWKLLWRDFHGAGDF